MIRIFSSKKEALEKVRLNTAIKIEAGGHKICIVNSKDSLYAVQDSCPHLGEGLHKGTVNYLNEIVCPWHSHRFNLLSGEESARRCKDAKIYVLEINDMGVFVKI